jgi:hypothetical protein
VTVAPGPWAPGTGGGGTAGARRRPQLRPGPLHGARLGLPVTVAGTRDLE